MKQEKITSISGASIYTTGGRRIAIGNAGHKVGDWVWVDSGYVFGHRAAVQNVPYVPITVDEYLISVIQTDSKYQIGIIPMSTNNTNLSKVDNVLIVETGGNLWGNMYALIDGDFVGVLYYYNNNIILELEDNHIIINSHINDNDPDHHNYVETHLKVISFISGVCVFETIEVLWNQKILYTRWSNGDIVWQKETILSQDGFNDILNTIPVSTFDLLKNEYFFETVETEINDTYQLYYDYYASTSGSQSDVHYDGLNSMTYSTTGSLNIAFTLSAPSLNMVTDLSNEVTFNKRTTDIQSSFNLIFDGVDGVKDMYHTVYIGTLLSCIANSTRDGRSIKVSQCSQGIKEYWFNPEECVAMNVPWYINTYVWMEPSYRQKTVIEQAEYTSKSAKTFMVRTGAVIINNELTISSINYMSSNQVSYNDFSELETDIQNGTNADILFFLDNETQKTSAYTIDQDGALILIGDGLSSIDNYVGSNMYIGQTSHSECITSANVGNDWLPMGYANAKFVTLTDTIRGVSTYKKNTNFTYWGGSDIIYPNSPWVDEHNAGNGYTIKSEGITGNQKSTLYKNGVLVCVIAESGYVTGEINNICWYAIKTNKQDLLINSHSGIAYKITENSLVLISYQLGQSSIKFLSTSYKKEKAINIIGKLQALFSKITSMSSLS